MNRSILTLSFAILLLITFSVNSQTRFHTDKDKTTINWKGFKPAGSHFGTIGLENGYFLVENDNITGGEFIIDMNNIINLDLDADGKWNKKLVDHLKSEDFFDVGTYPKAIFKITGTKQINDKTQITGDLTLKDKTNPVSFLATVSYEDSKMKVKSETFKIDRAKWNIKHKSKSFFEGLSDNFIYDDMEISIETVSEK